jgi:hypothetical protein
LGTVFAAGYEESEAKMMLDQYDGVLVCEVNHLDVANSFAEAKVVDVEKPKGLGIDPEFWLQSDIQIHPHYLGMTDEEFAARYKMASGCACN